MAQSISCHGFQPTSGQRVISRHLIQTNEEPKHDQIKERSSKRACSFFSQRTLISKLVGKADRERMVKGKAVLHLIGGKQKCTPVLAAPVPGASDPGTGAGARASAYKSADVPRTTHTPPSTVRRSSSSIQPPSARSQ